MKGHVIDSAKLIGTYERRSERKAKVDKAVETISEGDRIIET